MAAMPDFKKVLIGLAGLFVLPTVVSAAAGGLTALFAMKAVVGALTGAIGTMFGGINAAKIFGDAVGPGSTKGKPTVGRDPKTGRFTKLTEQAGRFGRFGRMLGMAGKAVPYLGTALGAGFGVMDQDYKEAEYGAFDRAALGITEGFLDLFDMGQNALGAAANFGLGTDFRTDYDMSGAFKETMTDPEVARWFMDPIKSLYGSLFGAVEGIDTGVMSGYENLNQQDYLDMYGPGGTAYNYDTSTSLSVPQPTATDAAPVAPSAVFTVPEVATQPQLTAPELETVNDVLSTESAALETQEMIRTLSGNLQPGITQQQADDITRYLKAIADNTDQ